MIGLYKKERYYFLLFFFSKVLKMQPAVFHKSHRCLLLSVIVINRPENGKM